jgi:hypothetical protein
MCTNVTCVQAMYWYTVCTVRTNVVDMLHVQYNVQVLIHNHPLSLHVCRIPSAQLSFECCDITIWTLDVNVSDKPGVG